MTDLAGLRRQLVERAAGGDSTARACLGVVDRLDAMTAGAPACPHATNAGSGWCAVAEAAGRGWAEARVEVDRASARADGLEASMRLSELHGERARIARADAWRDAVASRELLRRALDLLSDVARTNDGLGERVRCLAAEVEQHLDDPLSDAIPAPSAIAER